MLLLVPAAAVVVVVAVIVVAAFVAVCDVSVARVTATCQLLYVVVFSGFQLFPTK
jgi:hypothetical protein